MLSAFKNLPTGTKLSLISVILLFFAVPVTVLSANSIRDARSKAACVGDCYYPDPVVSSPKQPYYQIETCLNTTQRGTPTYCSTRTQTGGTSITLNVPTAVTTYYWVDTLLFSTYPNVQWYAYSNGQTNCGSAAAGSLCSRTLSWAAPAQTFQATNAGDATHNPCGAAGVPATCSAAKTVTYPGTTVQFVDFLPNYTFDVYVFIQGHLFNIIQNLNSGAAASFTKANLTLPANLATGISNNPTFRWSVVPGASKYAIWVAETNNFSTGAFWANNVDPSSCTGDCSKVWGSGGWTSQNGAPAAPAALVAGKTYYWLVWSCLSTGCPITALSQMYSFNVANTTQTAPTLIYPKDGQTGIDNNPNFQWTPSTGASSYAVALDDQNDILNLNHLYRGVLPASSCTTTCSLGWKNGTGWFALGSIAPKPYLLAPGKTYYWLVWACNPTECPLTGIRTGSFTTAGTINEVAPVIISPKGSVTVANGVPSFVWSPASGTTSTMYKLLLKLNNNNFASGGYFEKDLSPLICYAKPNCTTDLGGSWTYNSGGANIAQNPPNPLSGGRWYWIILNCKTTVCDLANLSASTTENFTVPVGLNSASGLNQTSGPCKSNGKVDVHFTWTPASNATSQTIYLSTQNNGFAPNTYLTINVPPLLGLIANNWDWNDILSNATHYWKISTQVNGSAYDSPTATFITPVCQADASLKYDVSRSGTKADVINYVYELAPAGVNDPRTNNPLADVLIYVMAGNGGLTTVTGPSPNGESGGGDCSYNPAYQTLGVFQYQAPTWSSQADYGSNENIPNYDSGHYGGGSCWKYPGADSSSWNNYYGGTNDANAWDPYAQIRATKARFLGSGECAWQVYTELYTKACP